MSTGYSAAGHGKYRCLSRVDTSQYAQVPDLTVSCQTRQNILAEKGDQQLSVSVRAGEVQVRCSVLVRYVYVTSLSRYIKIHSGKGK
ncbi:hypothetical protein SK128_020844 [Halocaridina rubra]|uniref:Uncharacterized protein n=1 Tax=Halocaridina rubra TaxID=373956 RepID=A0AAN9A0Z6_HALRR